MMSPAYLVDIVREFHGRIVVVIIGVADLVLLHHGRLASSAADGRTALLNSVLGHFPQLLHATIASILDILMLKFWLANRFLFAFEKKNRGSIDRCWPSAFLFDGTAFSTEK